VITPDISCVVCTYCRADKLERLFASLERQSLPPEAFEVVVVDNAADPEVRSLVDGWTGRILRLRYVAEPQLGLSHARNRGIAEAAAPLVAFIDDDAEADRSWIQAIVERFRDPDVAAVGGPARLSWEAPPPRWMSQHYWEHYSFVDRGGTARPLSFEEAPYGLNMAFRRSIFAVVGPFPAFLGRTGASLLSSEEIAVFWALMKRDLGVWYEPKAEVIHWIPQERVRVGYLLARAEAQGRSDALFDLHVREPSTAGPRGLMWNFFRKMLVRWRNRLRRRRSVGGLEPLLEAALAYGYVSGLRTYADSSELRRVGVDDAVHPQPGGAPRRGPL
jgi:glucosyl-dolichyl phosphate glucuronosyltransferase